MGFGKDGTGTIIRETIAAAALGALGGSDVVGFASPGITEDFRILKTVVYAAVDGMTASEGELLALYIGNGELLAAEVEAAIEADGPLDRNDRGGAELAERQVHLIGVGRKQSDADTFVQFESQEGGLIMEDKFRWTYSDSEGWAWFIYNMGGSMTTGSTLQLRATHYGVWVT